MMVAGLWMRPEHYGDPEAEIAAVRTAVGGMDLSTLGKMKLTGPGVPTLLERMYANRWTDLRKGRVRYGVMCNDEGVVMDDGVCARVGDEEWYMTTTSSGAGSVFEWIQWWMQSGWGEGVHLVNQTEAFAANITEQFRWQRFEDAAHEAAAELIDAGMEADGVMAAMQDSIQETIDAMEAE